MFRVGRLSPLIAVLLLCSILGFARDHKHWGEGFSIDLDETFDRVLEVVQIAVDDGVIRGTSQYSGTSQLDAALSSQTSKSFPNWTGGGTVLFKVRPDALSPEHFFETNDKGTVTVRYIVQSLGPNSTRLRIDATFKEDSLRRSHPSDGTPENAEFLAIADRLKDIHDKEQKDIQEAATKEQQTKLAALLSEFDQENAQLKAAQKKEQELKVQLQQKQHTKSAMVRTAGADLKAAPYNASKTVTTLSQGQPVEVLLESRSWCQVQTPSGDQGWVYRMMLEVPQ